MRVFGGVCLESALILITLLFPVIAEGQSAGVSVQQPAALEKVSPASPPKVRPGGAVLLGVKFSSTPRTEATSRFLARGGKAVGGTGNLDFQGVDIFQFPVGKLPGDVTRLRTVWSENGDFVWAEMTVPRYRAGENPSDKMARLQRVFTALSQQYGTPEIKKLQMPGGKFAAGNAYEWVFEDKTRVVLYESTDENLPLYVRFFNDALLLQIPPVTPSR